MFFLPIISSYSKKMIIHKACTSQCLIYYFLLLGIWIDSKLEPLCVLHFLTFFRNYVCMYILSYLQKTYNRTARKIISIFYPPSIAYANSVDTPYIPMSKDRGFTALSDNFPPCFLFLNHIISYAILTIIPKPYFRSICFFIILEAYHVHNWTSSKNV